MATCSTADCDRLTLARGLCAPHYSTWHRSQKRYTITCSECGRTVQVARRSTQFCSHGCGSLHAARTVHPHAQRRRSLCRDVELYIAPPRPEVHRSTTNRLTSGQCRVCDTWFVSPHMDVTCSADCRAAYHANRLRTRSGRRRARKVAAFRADVSPRRVFAADGYQCHLCRRKTDPSKKAPHPRSPTVDHLIPLAKGGTHEPSNCRTACFLCNSIKGDRGGGEQLMLVSV